VPERPVERFTFDPNTADSTQLLRLGLQPFQVRNIYKYRAAGGIYRKKEDFARLYGLTVKQYRELEPYIRISADYLPATTLLKEKSDTLHPSSQRDSYPHKIKEGETIDLSIADTTTLKRVPGIGSYFANQIVRLRQQLGGFAHIGQLDEIEDFPQQTKQFFVIEAQAPARLNVNRLSLNALKRHPYINYYQAKAIVDYRRLYGDIKSLQDLRFSKDFPEDAIQRLEPYVEY
jgi:DNA uptake protein ComE-like DNA-binding protein